jgi:predicted TIM-barrel fold metal-dependent hydrolase
MERNNIVLGFLSDPLDRVYEWVDAAPGKFIASPVIFDPTGVDLDELRHEYEAGRISGMGEIASQYRGFAPNDPELDGIFALAAEFDVPVLIHTEGIAAASPDFRIADGHPELLQEVLEKYPNLRLYMENAGYPFLAETISLMYRYPNVHADLSTITWIIPREAFYNYLQGLMDAGLGSRLMFGSDQMFWPESIELAIDAIESAPFLSHDQKRDIFYNNAARFLRLEDAH